MMRPTTTTGLVSREKEMLVTTMRRFLLLGLFLSLAPSLHAATWGEGLFDELAYDFGAVPRGSQVTHHFRIANTTNGNLQLYGARVSCGCTTARVLQSNLAPGQETYVVATMDTRRFFGVKSVTVYVNIGGARSEEVRLVVTSNSRDELMFAPEMLNFGKLKANAGGEATMTITLLGHASTQITEISSESNFIVPKVTELRRSGSEVTFQVAAQIRPETPAGRWFSEINLKTNNQSVSRVRVPVSVEIEAAPQQATTEPMAPMPTTPVQTGPTGSAEPAPTKPAPAAPAAPADPAPPKVQGKIIPNNIQLGQIKAGEETDRKLVLRGQNPFRIVSITGGDDIVSVEDAGNEPKTVHVLTVIVRPQSAGALQRLLRVRTDMPAAPEIHINAQAEILP